MIEVLEIVGAATGFAVVRPPVRVAWAAFEEATSAAPRDLAAAMSLARLVEPTTGYRLVGDVVPQCTAGLKRAKEASGLTWSEVAVVLGVSRRSVHNWLRGSRVRGINARRISAFYIAVITELEGATPGEEFDARDYMLRPGEDGESRASRIAAHLRSEYPRRPTRLSPWDVLRTPTAGEAPTQSGGLARNIRIASTSS
ncbi:MAG: helix-turn-helix domain-containing protein [Candidatus Nanopelagicales bacterium]|nr:helix-turn-helix domain-containing protein [Candidatus Nanopelagicales bacterium]MDZ4249636.1 helix-turn-helix domain-containing protein [Candidatus Nanopelagicales bacterium]